MWGALAKLAGIQTTEKSMVEKTRLYFGALVISLLAGLLTGLSVRPILDQVSDYSTPRMGLMTQPISLANKAPKLSSLSLRPSTTHRLLRARAPAVPTRFRLAEPHRPNESYGRPTGRTHAGHYHPPHTLILETRIQSRLYQNPCPEPFPTGLRKTAHDQPSAGDGTHWN